MASKGDIQREKKLSRSVNKHRKEREQLRKILKDRTKSPAERLEARRKIDSMPIWSIEVRRKNRDFTNGHSRSYIGKFGLSRQTFREMASLGLIPGVLRASC